jgi:hypothetical protein
MMKIKDFIGKVVKSKNTGKKYVLYEIDGVAITVREVEKNQYGTYSTYCWKTGTAPYDNAIAKGELVFEDEKLTELFRECYENYIHTEGRYDQYFYYSMKYD